MTTSSFAANAANWQTIKKQYPNVQVKTFPPEVIKALIKANEALVDAEKQRSDVAKRILESREAYLNRARAWTNIGEKLYLDTLSQ